MRHHKGPKQLTHDEVPTDTALVAANLIRIHANLIRQAVPRAGITEQATLDNVKSQIREIRGQLELLEKWVGGIELPEQPAEVTAADETTETT